MTNRAQSTVTSKTLANCEIAQRARGLAARRRKPGRSAMMLAVFSAAAMFAVRAASAAPIYWDGNGATPGAGATAAVAGTWGTSAFWSTSSTGQLATTTTGPGAGDDAYFVAWDTVDAGFANPTGAYTVTLSAPQSVNSIVMGEANTGTIASAAGTLTLKGSVANTLTIGAGGVILNASNGDPTFDATLPIILGASQTWTINNAHVIAIKSAVSGSATAGNTYTWTLGFVNAFNPTVQGVVSDGIAGGNVALTVLDTSTGGNYQITGVANTYTGKSSVAQGIVQVALLANLGVASSFGAPTTVANGTIDMGNNGAATLIYNGSVASSTNRVLNLAGATSGVTLTNNSTAATSILTFTSDFTATGVGAKTLTLRGSNTGLNTIGGAIVDSTGGNTALVKNDAGQWVLGGNNTYSGGTTVIAGTLTLLAASNLGSNVVGNNVSIAGGNIVFGSGTNVGANQAVNVTAAGGGIGVAADPTSFPTVTVAGGATVVFGIDYTGDGGIQTGTTAGFFTASTTTFLGSFTTGIYTGATLTAGSGTTYRLGGGGGTLTIQNNVLTGANNLLIGGTGGGTIILPNANTYSGTTTIGASTVKASLLGNVGTSASSFGAPTTTTNATINLGSLTSVATLDYTGGGETTNRVLNINSTTGAISLLNDGSGPLIFSNPLTFANGAKTLTLGGSNGGTITGVVNSPGVTTLVKSGVGTWILSGAGTNTYTGNTSVSAGVLQAPDLLAGSNLITLAGSAASLAVLQIQNASPSTFTRTVGTAAGNVSLNGGYAGFAAKTSKLTVNLGGNAQLAWASGNFLGTGGSALVFGSPTADAQVEFTNPINLNTTDNFVRTAFVDKGLGGDSALLSGIISSATAPNTSGFSKDGPGTLFLSAANTYAGQTIVKNGTLIVLADSLVGTAGSLGTGTSTNLISIDTAAATNNLGVSTKTTASAALLIGGAFTIARPITVNNTATSGTYSIGGTADANATYSGLVTFNQPLTITQATTSPGNSLSLIGGLTGVGARVLTFANLGAVNVSTTGITGATASVLQSGVGTTTFAAANNYGGGTTISAGTLLLAASNTLQGATGATLVQGGSLSSNVAATTLGGNLSMTSGSITPDGTSVGSFTLAAGKNFAMSGGTLAMSITAPATFDQITGSGAGTFALGGTLDLTGDTLDYTQTYQILSGFTSGTVSGLAITGYDNVNFAANVDNTGLLSFAPVSAVPEPASLALLALAAPCLLRRRRKI